MNNKQNKAAAPARWKAALLVAGLVWGQGSYSQDHSQDVSTPVKSPAEGLNVESKRVGTGPFLGLKQGSSHTVNMELGYLFQFQKHQKTGRNGKASRAYIGQNNAYRLGFSMGLQGFQDEPVVQADDTVFHSAGYGYYGKLLFSSPVLLNFIAISGHIKVLYLFPAEMHSRDIANARMAFGIGQDVEFWVTDDSCATLGFTDEGDSHALNDRSDAIFPSKVRFTFGFKKFF